MLCFHGMTLKAFNGESVISPWVCSDDGFTYLYPIEHAYNEGYTMEDSASYFCINLAMESAIIQSAVNNDSGYVVFIMDIPEDELEVDYSCENMEFCRRIPCERFDELREAAEVLHFSFNPQFSLFVIAGLIDNYQFNKSALSEDVIKAAELISQIDYSAIYDSIYGY